MSYFDLKYICQCLLSLKIHSALILFGSNSNTPPQKVINNQTIPLNSFPIKNSQDASYFPWEIHKVQHLLLGLGKPKKNPIRPIYLKLTLNSIIFHENFYCKPIPVLCSRNLANGNGLVNTSAN